MGYEMNWWSSVVGVGLDEDVFPSFWSLRCCRRSNCVLFNADDSAGKASCGLMRCGLAMRSRQFATTSSPAGLSGILLPRRTGWVANGEPGTTVSLGGGERGVGRPVWRMGMCHGSKSTGYIYTCTQLPLQQDIQGRESMMTDYERPAP